jgi:hypothetical protein
VRTAPGTAEQIAAFLLPVQQFVVGEAIMQGGRYRR